MRIHIFIVPFLWIMLLYMYVGGKCVILQKGAGMARILGEGMPGIPWQEKPERCNRPVWRYTGNPVIGRDGNRVSNSVFNSAVAAFAGGFAGIFRCDSFSVSMDLFVGRSSDGIHWTIEDTPIQFATGITGRPSAWPIPTIFAGLCSWKTPFCPATGTECCFRERLAVCIPCSAGPAITGTRPLEIFLSARAGIWSFGAGTAM